MKKTPGTAAALLFTVFLILFSVFTVVNTKGFYTAQYRKNGTAEDTGMSEQDLENTTVMLLDYLNGRRNDLEMTAEKWGAEEQVFDRREKTHMTDVKNLYRYAFDAMIFCLAASVSAIIIIIRQYPAQAADMLTDGYKKAALFTRALAVGLAAAFRLGFDSFWTAFHQVFFTNDLWLLDPHTSTMINMFPLEFFLAMCTRMLLLFVALFVCAGILTAVAKAAYAKKSVGKQRSAGKNT